MSLSRGFTSLARRATRAIVAVLATGLALAATPALAQVSAEFTTGAIAEYSSSNANQNDNAASFAELGITKIVMSQSGGRWGGTQGNDLNVTIVIHFAGGGTYSFSGALNWQKNDGGNAIPIDYFGVVASADVPDGADGYFRSSPTLKKTYILALPTKVASSGFATLVGNDQVDGSANLDSAAIFSALTIEFPPPNTPPTFTGATGTSNGVTAYSFNYSENRASGATLGQVAATDAQGNPITFSIVGGNTSGWFAINSTTGAITLTAAGATSTANDYEQTPNSTTITVRAFDGTNETLIDVVLNETDLSDTAPVFTATNATAGGVPSYSYSYVENAAAGATLAQVSATDPDNGTLTYSITGGDPLGWYAINPTTGAISLTALGAASAANDFEQGGNAQTLTVQVTDGVNATTIQVALAETNAADAIPTFTTANTTDNGSPAYAFSYVENAAVGTEIGQVAASDADGQTLSYRITGGDPLGWYAIDPATGKITLTAAGAASVANDFEQDGNVHALTVEVTDGANPVTITVTLSETNAADAIPAFTGATATSGGSPAYAFTYVENAAEGATVGQVAATDADGQTLSYRITGGNTSGWYAIDPATGAITLTAAGAESVANDFEQDGNVHALTVEVTDGTNPVTITVTLSETNAADAIPAFTTANTTDNGSPAYAFSYVENAAAGVTLGQVAATDADGQVLTFRIAGGDALGWYAINPATGAISLTPLGAASLANDFESTPNARTLTVEVTDGTHPVLIAVVLTETDIDDAAPVIATPGATPGATEAELSVNEGVATVTRLVADEAVIWSITGGNDLGRFEIAPDGTISFRAAPDFENPSDSDTNNTYVLVVQAVDTLGNLSTQTVTVRVLDLDDTAPTITGPNGATGAASALTINEGLTAVTTFTANEPVTWSIEGGSDEAAFAIDPSTGAVTLRTAPDFENPTDSDRNNTYVVRIKAVDRAGNISYQTLTVTIANVDEIARKLVEIGGKLRDGLRGYAVHGLSDMLSFNEALMRGGNEDICSDPKARQLSGSMNASDEGGNASLRYAGQLNECGRRHKVLADAGLTSSRFDGNWTTRLFAALRMETRIDADLTVGLGVLASRASDDIAGFESSAIADTSVQANLYARYRLAERLRMGAFVALGRSWYDFDLQEADGFALDGKMTGNRRVFGWMLSGDFAVAGTVLTTDAVVSRAIEKLGNARLSARYLGEDRSDIAFAVGTVDVTRISVPVTAPITLTGSEGGIGSWSRLLLSPGLLCEDNDAASSSLNCGYQLGAKLVANDGGRNRFYADYHWESVSGLRRSLIALGVGHRFGSTGPELALEVNRGLGAMAGQDNRAMLSLRVGAR